ncbi:hypothetical protein Y032_0013g2047 [Ancylostoma ceylanicum]|uniref:Uncharacterized protein n=1 Tax=Ancylostoma ceylanicum TaxID=53326 RepID=A0A016VBN5_9BILA|nr:hypothetical protein Y032_0013g2047 [Ancylostoma ceylanicum]
MLHEVVAAAQIKRSKGYAGAKRWSSACSQVQRSCTRLKDDILLLHNFKATKREVARNGSFDKRGMIGVV